MFDLLWTLGCIVLLIWCVNFSLKQEEKTLKGE
jgi:protein-S-isoprenylcysteine O-methyltransferase Ste14